MDKELTAVEILKLLKDFVLGNNKSGLDQSFINGSCDIIEKNLKALDIISNKMVFIEELVLSDDLEDYNYHVEDQGRYDEDKLTQEEFDLLQEVL